MSNVMILDNHYGDLQYYCRLLPFPWHIDKFLGHWLASLSMFARLASNTTNLKSVDLVNTWP